MGASIRTAGDSIFEERRMRLFKNYSPNVAPTPIQDAYIDTIEDNDESAYPANGRQGDYWYVKI